MSDQEARRLAALLAERGEAWPAAIEHYSVIGSTSDLIRQRARENAPEWSLVLADRQTAGRGRHGRAWISPDGSLSFSVLLRPRFEIEACGLLALAAGLAIAEGVEPFGVTASVKWPNDVVVTGRKLAGVLAEGSVGPAGLDTIVLGIGINVALDLSELPPAVREQATSLRSETGRDHDRLAVAAETLERLRLWYHALACGESERVLRTWRDRSVPWWGRRVEVHSGGTALTGIARGIDQRGAFLLEQEEGSVRAIVSGEVRELRLK